MRFKREEEKEVLIGLRVDGRRGSKGGDEESDRDL